MLNIRNKGEEHMRTGSGFFKTTAFITAALLLALLLCSILMLSYSIAHRSSLSDPLSDNGAEAFTPLQTKYSLMALPEKEPANHDIKLVQTGRRLFQGFCRALVSVPAKLSVLALAAVAISAFLAFTGNINNHTSEISLRVGGHAPPFLKGH